MASSTTHAQASVVSGAYLPFKDACSRMLEDAGFKDDTEGSVICLKMARFLVSVRQSKQGDN